MDDTQQPAVLDHGKRRTAVFGNFIRNRFKFLFACRVGVGSTVRSRSLIDMFENGVDGTLTNGRTVDIDTAHPALRGKWNELRLKRLHITAADTVPFLGKYHDGTAFRRFVRQGCKLRCICQLLFAHPLYWEEASRLPVPKRNGAGLIEQQRIHVPCRLDGSTRHGKHVETHETVHASNADSRQQSPDCRGDKRNE